MPPGSAKPHLSASQLKTYELCPRKWAWAKLDGIEAPPGAGAALGSEVHRQIERYYKEGIPFDLTTKAGEIALAGAHLLPPPGTPGLLIEDEFEWVFKGHRIIGAKDMRLTAGDIPEVKDHKTTSSFAWALTPENFADDIQAAIYAGHEFDVANVGACVLSWHYLQTRKPYKSHVVSVCLTPADIAPTLERVEKLANEIALIRESGARALDLPYNADACQAFGGCFYINQCNLTPTERFRSIMSQEQDKDTFLAMMRARREAAGGAGGAINPPPVRATPTAKPPTISACGQWRLDEATNTWVANTPPPPPAPPAAPPPPAPPADPPPPPAPPADPPPPPAPPADPPPPEPAEAPKRKGRKPKATTAAQAEPAPAGGVTGSDPETTAKAYEAVAEGYAKAAAILRGESVG